MLELDEKHKPQPDGYNIVARVEECKGSCEKEVMFQVMNGPFQGDINVEPFFRYLERCAR